MPLHNWKNVDAGLYHHFHQVWTIEICRVLNRGLLPDEYSALIEQRSPSKEPDVVALELNEPRQPWAGSGGTAILERPRTRIVRELTDEEHYAAKASRIVVRHRLGRIVAFIEIVSPGNKKGKAAIEDFVEKVVQAIRAGVHVLVVDPFPPTPRDPFGIHKAIWDHIREEDFDLPESQNRVLASYESTGAPSAFIETVGMGEALPAMPLFIEPGAHVLAPLEGPYMAAWLDSPPPMQRLVTHPENTP